MIKNYKWMLSAILTICGTLALTSCSENDDPIIAQSSSMTKGIVGEWIFEQEVDNIELNNPDITLEPSANGYLKAVIYHFDADGSCWKEINVMNDNKMVYQFTDRYSTGESTYTINAAGKVIVKLANNIEESINMEGLHFDGTKLTAEGADAYPLVRATSEQIKLYKEEADAWHGGSESTLSNATAADLGKIVDETGHLHPAKKALPKGCIAVGILAKVTKEGGHGLIIAVWDEKFQNLEDLSHWKATDKFANTTLLVTPDNWQWSEMKRYTTLGKTPVSNWALAQKSDYEEIFKNLGSTTGNNDGKVYDDNVNAYITTGTGGRKIRTNRGFWSATKASDGGLWYFDWEGWYICSEQDYSMCIRPVLGF